MHTKGIDKLLSHCSDDRDEERTREDVHREKRDYFYCMHEINQKWLSVFPLIVFFLIPTIACLQTNLVADPSVIPPETVQKGPAIEQTHYSLLDRFIELELWHPLDYHEMGLAIWSPLEGGILTGKYNDHIPESCRIAQLKAINSEGHDEGHWLTPENLEKLQALNQLAQELELTMSQLSLAWLLHQEQVTTLITGASEPPQIVSNTQASGINLSDQTLTRIEEILQNRPEYHRNWEIFNYRWFQSYIKDKKDRKAWK